MASGVFIDLLLEKIVFSTGDYVGFTNDILRRLSEHNRIKGKNTHTGLPWVLVSSEEFASKKEVMKPT